jgi:hypothetical protein
MKASTTGACATSRRRAGRASAVEVGRATSRATDVRIGQDRFVQLLDEGRHCPPKKRAGDIYCARPWDH